MCTQLANAKHKVAIIGCGRLGQHYATAYSTYTDTEIVAIAEFNKERRIAVGQRFGVKNLYQDAESLLKEIVPDIGVVVTPTKWMKESVIACAEAGVKGVSTDKPIAASLSDADAMVDSCKSNGVVFAGGNLPRAHNHVQEAAKWLREGKYGEIQGAIVSSIGNCISGQGVQWISALRLFMNSEVGEVMCWGQPESNVYSEDDEMLSNGIFSMTNGVNVPFYGTSIDDSVKTKIRKHDGVKATHKMGLDVWTEDSLIRWFWDSVEIYKGFDKNGKRILTDPEFSPWKWQEFGYMTSSIRSLIKSIETGSELAVSGHDLRQALEVAIAMKLSAQKGNVPIKLPLVDRTHTLIPEIYRWIGGDQTGNIQSVEEASTDLNM